MTFCLKLSSSQDPVRLSLDMLWIFFILLLNHSGEVDASYGQPCQNSSVCEAPAEECIFINGFGNCKCADGYYEYNFRNPYCLIKIPHGGECEASEYYNDACNDPTMKCMLDKTGQQTRCLCDSGSYFSPMTKSCSSMEDLAVFPTSHFWDSQSIRLFWSADKHGSAVTYTVEVSPDGGQVDHQPGDNSVYVSGLIPGTKYNFTITSVLPTDSFYATKTISKVKDGLLTSCAPVSSLNVGNITSSSAIATWLPPTQPHGEITGYSIVVKEGRKCVFGHLIRCSSCSSISSPDELSNCQTMNTASMAVEELNDDSTTITTEILYLEPYHNYSVTVTACSEYECRAETNIVSFRTEMTAASDLLNLTLTSARDDMTTMVSLTASWTPGPYTGPTTYLITLLAYSDTISDYHFYLDLELTGYTNTTWTRNIFPFWPHQVYVIPTTNAGWGKSLTRTIMTATTNPGVIGDLSVEQDSIIAEEVTIEFLPRNLYGNLKDFVIRKTLYDTNHKLEEQDEYQILSQSGRKYTAEQVGGEQVGGVMVERNYSFAVKVRNTDYESNYSTDFPLYVQPRAPLFSEALLTSHGVPTLFWKPENPRLRETTIDIAVCASCLLDGRQGSVKRVGLIVCKVELDGECLAIGAKEKSAVNFDDFTSWKKAHLSNFTELYRATPDGWLLTLPSPKSSYPYTVGADTSCSQEVDTVYCNGPLPNNTHFRVAAIQCNSVGCLLGKFEGPFFAGSDLESVEEVGGDDEDIGLFIGVGLAAAVIVVISILVAVILFRRRAANKKEEKPYNTAATSMTDAHVYHGIGGAAYVTSDLRNGDRADQISMAGLNQTAGPLQDTADVTHHVPDYLIVL